jgi:hypothetical protein
LVASLCSALVKNSFGALIMRHYRLPCGSHYQVCNSAPILLTGAGWSLRPLKMDPPRYFYRRGYWCMSTRNEALGQASNPRLSEAKEPSIERGRLRACGTPPKKPFSLQKKMVPTGGRLLNRCEDTNSLFKTLDHWNHILEGLRKESTKSSTDRLPQAKRRASPPVQRKRKIGGEK